MEEGEEGEALEGELAEGVEGEAVLRKGEEDTSDKREGASSEDEKK